VTVQCATSSTPPAPASTSPQIPLKGVKKTPSDPAIPTKDPYDSPEERAEGCFVGKIVTLLLASFGLKDQDGFCSTYREWHIFWAGIWAGARAAQFADIPECPEYWIDEMQYYRGGAILANVAKIYGTSALATIAGIWVWANQSGLLKIAGLS
jgi:hypothetical protein